MKTKLFIICAVLLSLGLGCKKETEQIDRYQVFSASWEELATGASPDGKEVSTAVPEKKLIKVDTVTGRVWAWESSSSNGKLSSGWLEMTDSGYVAAAAQQNVIK